MMTKLIYLFLLLLPARFAVANADPVDQAAGLVKTGNAAELGKMFAQTVDLTILNDADMHSATQATQIVDRFFKANAVRSVKVVHRVNSNATIKYGVMSVVTSGGNYRISISLKANNGDFKIIGMRIEAEK